VGVAVNVFLLMILSQITDVVQIPENQLNTAVLISVFLTFSIILFDVCKPFNAMRVILYGVVSSIAVLCIIFMPMLNAFWDGKLNLFMLQSITDPTTIFMIFTLLLITIYTIRVGNFIANQFKLDEKGKVYLDKEIWEKAKALFKREKEN
ncbi:MAG TPA: hypothetical protein PLZ09_03200, partial [Clostridia bacterium]|nr:hypothetical protein [Clostridia bacterium]